MDKDKLQVELKKISKASHTPLKLIVKEFKKTFSSDFVQNDSQFKNQEQRVRYCLSVTTMTFSDRHPVKPFDLIPIGYGPLRSTKAGNAYIEMFGLVYGYKDGKANKTGKFRRVQLKKPEMLDIITIDLRYNGVLLSAFSKKADSDLSADDRAEFLKGEFIEDFDWRKKVKTRKIELSQLINEPSEVNTEGFTVMTDWVSVRGIIAGKLSGKNEKTGSEWGMYRINGGFGDVEFDDNSAVETVPVWISPKLMQYGVASECIFHGTNQINEDSEPSINCFRVTPIIATPIDD